MIGHSLFLFAVTCASLVSASYEAACSNNEYFPMHSGLVDEWSYVASSPSDRNYTADWTFHPQSFTINLHLTAIAALPLTDPDLLVGLSTRNGSVMFNTSLSPLMPRAALLGNSYDKTWFLGRLRGDSSVWALQAVQSETGKLLETVSPVPAPDNAPIACFHNDVLYVISGDTISLFYYNHTTKVMKNVWTRRNMPMRARDASTCNIESNGYLFYYSESQDKTKSINLVSKGGRLAWGTPPPNRFPDFKTLVYTPAATLVNRTIYLAGMSDGTYYSVDSYGTAQEIVIDPEYQPNSRRDRFIRYSKKNVNKKSFELNFDRSSPFVISASEMALSIDRSFWTGQQTLFALKEGKLAWKAHLTGSNNTYQMVIDDEKHQVYVMKVAVEDDGEKGFVFNLDGTFVEQLPPAYSGQNVTIFKDAAFFLQYQKLPNGGFTPRIIGLKRNLVVKNN